MLHFYDACSEGMNLTQDDERTYWGIITEVKQTNAKIDNDPDNQRRKEVKIDGAIMLGTGLEPCSIGRFKMIETAEEMNTEVNEPVEDGGYVKLSPENLERNVNRFDILYRDDEPGERLNSYDSPGSFE
jgi:hypothetical protein